MRLALASGHVDVDAMLDSIDEGQFREWMAFDSITPIGPERIETIAVNAVIAICGQLMKFCGGRSDEVTAEKLDPWRASESRTSRPRERQQSAASAKSNLEQAILLAQLAGGLR